MEINFNYELPKYGTRFKLENHGESCMVQFISADLNSYRCESCHRITKPKVKWISCLDVNCELCKSADSEISKVKYICYVPVYHYAKDKLMIWERPLSWCQESLTRLIDTHGMDGFINTVFNITRIGEHGSIHTSYMIVPIYDKGYPLRKLNHAAEQSRITYDININTWTPQEQQYYLTYKKFPDIVNRNENVL